MYAIFSIIKIIVLFPGNGIFAGYPMFAENFLKFPTAGKIRVCSFITCRIEGVTGLYSRVSGEFLCFPSVHDAGEELEKWVTAENSQIFYLDMTCSKSLDFLTQADYLNLFTVKHVFLLVYPKMAASFSDATKALEELNFTVTSQVYLAFEQPTSDVFEIYEVYKLDPNEQIILEKTGTWTRSSGITFETSQSQVTRRMDTKGRTFQASIVINHKDTYNHLDDLVDLHVDGITKYNYKLVNIAVETLNGSVEYTAMSLWGVRHENGQFDGMVGLAQQGLIEILATPLILSSERAEIIEHLAITTRIRVKFIFLSPPLSYKNNIFVLPFGWDVWYSVVALMAITILFLYMFAIYENGVWLSNVKDKEQAMIRKLPRSWKEIVFVCLGIICQQDMVAEPKSIPGRILIFFMKIAILFLYVSYTAAIVVLLQSSDTSIRTLKDLYESNMKIGLHEIPYNHYYFEEATEPVRKAISGKVSKESYATIAHGVKKVRLGLFAFHVERSPGYLMARKFMNEDEKCRLQELDESYLPAVDPALTVRRNFSYSRILRHIFYRMHESGHISREILRSTAKKPTCKEISMTYMSVGLIDCQEAFLLLSMGVCTSFLILLSECVIHKRKQQQTKSNNSIFLTEFVH